MNKVCERLPWRFRFVAEWFPYMSLDSVLRFRRHEVESENGSVNSDLLTLQLKQPIKGAVSLRRKGSDVLTFQEVVKDEVYRGVRDQIRDCQTVVDLGANIGLASLYFANSFPACRVMAVEPNPTTYALLETNLSSLIATGRCRVAKLAVWSHEAALAADNNVEPDHYSAFATKEASKGSDNNIEGVTMETLLSQSGFSVVDLLKVDIEGAEVELFKGRVDWLKRINAIAIEFHGDSRSVCKFDQLMSDYGFRIVQEEAHTVIAVKAR
jgi:FkbM family methyltransferase